MIVDGQLKLISYPIFLYFLQNDNLKIKFTHFSFNKVSKKNKKSTLIRLKFSYFKE